MNQAQPSALWQFHEQISQNQSRVGLFIWWVLGTCGMSFTTFYLLVNTGLILPARLGGINMFLCIILAAHMFMGRRKQQQQQQVRDAAPLTTGFTWNAETRDAFRVFYQRVGLANPDRVLAVWLVSSAQGRDCIVDLQTFTAAEIPLLLGAKFRRLVPPLTPFFLYPQQQQQQGLYKNPL